MLPVGSPTQPPAAPPPPPPVTCMPASYMPLDTEAMSSRAESAVEEPPLRPSYRHAYGSSMGGAVAASDTSESSRPAARHQAAANVPPVDVPPVWPPAGYFDYATARTARAPPPPPTRAPPTAPPPPARPPPPSTAPPPPSTAPPTAAPPTAASLLAEVDEFLHERAPSPPPPGCDLVSCAPMPNWSVAVSAAAMAPPPAPAQLPASFPKHVAKRAWEAPAPANEAPTRQPAAREANTRTGAGTPASLAPRTLGFGGAELGASGPDASALPVPPPQLGRLAPRQPRQTGQREPSHPQPQPHRQTEAQPPQQPHPQRQADQTRPRARQPAQPAQPPPLRQHEPPPPQRHEPPPAQQPRHRDEDTPRERRRQQKQSVHTPSVPEARPYEVPTPWPAQQSELEDTRARAAAPSSSARDGVPSREPGASTSPTASRVQLGHELYRSQMGRVATGGPSQLGIAQRLMELMQQQPLFEPYASPAGAPPTPPAFAEPVEHRPLFKVRAEAQQQSTVSHMVDQLNSGCMQPLQFAGSHSSSMLVGHDADPTLATPASKIEAILRSKQAQ